MTQFSPPTVVSLEAVQSLREAITDLFQVFDTTLDAPERGYVRFRGQFLQDPDACFDDLRGRFERFGFTPMIRNQNDQIALIGLPVVFQSKESNRTINLVLLIATILSTLFVGATYVATTQRRVFYDLARLAILFEHHVDFGRSRDGPLFCRAFSQSTGYASLLHSPANPIFHWHHGSFHPS